MYSPHEQQRWFEISKYFLKMPSIRQLEDLQDLKECIRFHEWKYYVQNDPVISDFEFDQLFKLLEKTESQYPQWITADSPSQRIASDLNPEFQSVAHLNAMLSLENSYREDDLFEFDKRVKKLISPVHEVQYYAEPKFDGGSIAVVYENDHLVRAATRGDGLRGDDITANARTMRSLPLTAKFSKYGIRKIELRGEAVISKKTFHRLNKQRESDGLPLLANPRNAATGVLRVKDPKETASRGIELFVFQVSYVEMSDGAPFIQYYPGHDDAMKLLAQLGFKVDLHDRQLCDSIEEVIAFVQKWALRREDYPYEIDGVVVKLNSFALQEMCGFTSHHPRWAVAHKFQAKQATSVLRNVEFQVGKIGSVTPVAKIDPVQLAGVTVSSVSLHNEDFIRQRDIRYGDQVLVERAGDVIPYIVRSFPELRKGHEKEIVFPKDCPSCKTPLIREADEAAWRCPNYNCQAQQVQRLIHHVSKDAMDIDGLGKSLVERFYELGWLKNMADIYRLDYGAIAQLEGMGKKSSDKLRQSIDRAKKNPIHRLLHALSIHHLGKRVSKLIAEHLSYLPDLQHWTLDNFTAIKDVGPVVGQNIMDFFKDPQNRQMIAEMEMLGVNMHQTADDRPRETSGEAALAGKTILFTGTLSKMGRKEAQELAEKNGAKLLSAVSANLDMLVVGKDPGSKLSKAKNLGTIRILSEEEFLEIVGKA